MNYGRHNHHTIARLINKRLVNLNDVFVYYSTVYEDWFVVSRYVDLYNWIWGYRISQNKNPGYDNIIVTFIYFNLERKSQDYPTEFVRFSALHADWYKFKRILYKTKLDTIIDTAKIRAEHEIIVGNKKRNRKMLLL